MMMPRLFLRKGAAWVSAMVLGLTGLGIATSAQVAHGFPDIPVTSILNDTGDVTQSTNYRVESDTISSSYFDGVDSVSSILQGGINNASRDWILDTRSSTTRTVLVDLRAPVPNSGAQPIFAWQLVPTRIIVKCHEALAGSFPAIQLNQTVSCPTSVAFLYAGTEYRLVMSSGPGAVINFPETNDALVTCTAVDSSNQCKAWTILPITQADGTVQNVARLQKAAKNGSFSTNLGDFYLTFKFNVTNP